MVKHCFEVLVVYLVSDVYCWSFLQNSLKLFSSIPSNKPSSQCVVASGKPIYYLANKKKKKRLSLICHQCKPQPPTMSEVDQVLQFLVKILLHNVAWSANGLEFHSYLDCKTFWGNSRGHRWNPSPYLSPNNVMWKYTDLNSRHALMVLFHMFILLNLCMESCSFPN